MIQPIVIRPVPLTPLAAKRQRAVLVDLAESLRQFAREVGEIIRRAVQGIKAFWARYGRPIARAQRRYAGMDRRVATQLRTVERRAARRARNQARRRQRLALV